ncbi:MAG TPA: hypothetical protein PLH19_11240 [Anaerolineae bacterium]|nr:hypothetical protein [Anaerolineae bacterium]HQH39094.1 hypothetical protein [Anaerolineae bacterium]
MTARAVCPSCGEWVKLLDHPKIGQKVACPHCEANLEVIEVAPVELDWAYVEADDDLDDADWDDDELDLDDEDWDEDEAWDDEEDTGDKRDV